MFEIQSMGEVRWEGDLGFGTPSRVPVPQLQIAMRLISIDMEFKVKRLDETNTGVGRDTDTNKRTKPRGTPN